MIEALRIADGLSSPGTPLVGVEAGTVNRNERATVQLVGTALRGDHRLCTTEAAVFSVVVIGDDADVGDGIFRRRDDCGSTPHCADGADSVDRNAICTVLLAVGIGLWTVFGGRCSGCARTTRTLITRGVIDAATGALGAIANDTRCKLGQREHVAVERGKMLNIVAADGAADIGGFRIDGGRRGSVNGHFLGSPGKIELNVYGVGLFRNQLEVG